MRQKANSFAKPFRKHARGWTFLSPGFESVTSTSVFRQRSAKRRLGCGNKFLPLVVLSDRPGPRIRKRRHLLRWEFWQISKGDCSNRRSEEGSISEELRPWSSLGKPWT